MTDTYNQLKQELSVLYPEITDEEMTQATKNLIDFFTIGTKIIQKVNRSKRNQELLQLQAGIKSSDINDV